MASEEYKLVFNTQAEIQGYIAKQKKSKVKFPDRSLFRNGLKIPDGCIIGDHSRLNNACVVGNDVTIGDNSVIDSECTFGSYVTVLSAVKINYGAEFREYAHIYNDCTVGPCVRFGDRAAIKPGVVFENGTVFGSHPSIGSRCVIQTPKSIGDHAFFGEGAVITTSMNFELGDFPDFHQGVSFDGHTLRKRTSWHREPMLKFGGGGSEGRTVYAFDTVDGIFIRAGCFHGSLAEFRAEVRMNRRGITATLYYQFADLCETAWPQPKPRAPRASSETTTSNLLKSI